MSSIPQIHTNRYNQWNTKITQRPTYLSDTLLPIYAFLLPGFLLVGFVLAAAPYDEESAHFGGFGCFLQSSGFGGVWLLILFYHYHCLKYLKGRGYIITLNALMTWTFVTGCYLTLVDGACIIILPLFILYLIISIRSYLLYWSIARNKFDKIAGIFWFGLFLGIQSIFLAAFRLSIYAERGTPVLFAIHSIFMLILVITFWKVVNQFTRDFDKFLGGIVVDRVHRPETSLYIWRCDKCEKVFLHIVDYQTLRCPHCQSVVIEGMATTGSSDHPPGPSVQHPL